MIRMMTVWCAVAALAFGASSHARTFEETSYRTPDGNLIRKGMSKKDVLAAFRRPDDKMALAGPKGCSKVELWTYLIDRQVLMLTFTGKNVQQVKIVEPDR
jgi:hypothetical protein